MRFSTTSKRYFLPYLTVSFLTIYLTFSYIVYSPLYGDQIANEIGNEEQTSHVSPSKSHPNLSCLEGNSDEERYMTYLPHSGFHNQRNSLENAIFLSWVLNRTLIMPPIIFTKNSYFPHRPFNTLYNMLNGNLTRSITACKTKGTDHKYCKFTQLDWEALMNFNFIKNNIRYIHRKDLNFDVNELYSFLNITDPNSQVYTLAEETRYEFQFYDDESITQVSNDQFEYLVHLCSLQQRKEKLIHFGSIYHLLRFNLKFKENIEFIESVRENMIINHPMLLEIGEKISEQLGGLGSYIGVHLRLGDNGLDRKFGEKAQENVDNIVKKLLNELEDITKPETSLDEIDVSMNNYVPTKTMLEAEKCLQSIAPELRNYPIIYISSDKPRNDPRLKKILKEFPCVFTLSHFENYLDPLKKLQNSRDGILLFDYFVPFIDGIIAARGNKFIGTPESTFSDYVERLHERWIGV